MDRSYISLGSRADSHAGDAHMSMPTPGLAYVKNPFNNRHLYLLGTVADFCQ